MGAGGKRGGGWGGGRGGLRGIGGGMTPHLQFQVHMLTICFKRVQNPHFLGIFRGGGGRDLYKNIIRGGFCIL